MFLPLDDWVDDCTSQEEIPKEVKVGKDVTEFTSYYV